MAKKKKTASAFDATNTRYCATCTLDVKISLGGEANWDSHVKSAAHVRLEGSAHAQGFCFTIFQQVSAEGA
ncbi:hypothetical protein L208DRAFT_1402589 [Tricholoma matsutake]|nr:hypothetical protein L208DRAFT_1402589 [Tricholoma matsutake 945]